MLLPSICPAIPTSMTYVATGTSSTSTITIPATAQAGDIAIITDWACYINDGTPVSGVTPSGFTLIADVVGSTDNAYLDQYGRINISYKKLVAGDAGTTLTGMNSSGELKSIVVFRPDSTINTVTLLGNGGQVVGNADPSGQTVTVSGTYPVVTLAMCSGFYLDGGAFVSPSFSGMTSRATQVLNNFHTDALSQEYDLLMNTYTRAYTSSDSKSNFGIDVGYYNNGFLTGLANVSLAFS